MSRLKSNRSDLWKLKIRKLCCHLTGKRDESLMLAFKEQRLKDELSRSDSPKPQQKQ
ncbi:hypothetical protein [Marinobacter sp. SS13-12]|uniref:hypothetical protein n=1 Tax=Marinobacter sp. SS13-12 TaxID=3050451 RepID=UPI002554E5F5|nr:hypothetical protein [Marinobacter sp. SS13-12]MDK8465909.1 hypothetical protein [Marinobacter sp. SS13-12]